MDKTNRLTQKHIDNLREGYYVIIDMLREVDSPWIAEKLAKLLQEIKQKAKSVCERSDMKIPQWCIDE